MLDVLQPPVRVQDDQGEEEQKKSPPIDNLAVSEFLESGLTKKGLGDFLNDASTLDGDNKGPNQRAHPGTFTDEGIDALGYKSAPSYPILFSFSEELRAIVDDQAALPRAVSSSSSLPTNPVEHKKDTNPFAGPAIAAAMARRGFGLLPSGKPTPLNPQQPSKGVIPSNVGVAKAPAPAKKQRPQLTMETHLRLMTRQCQAIFEKPEEAVTKSIKVVHTLGLLASDLTPRTFRDTMNEVTQLSNDVNNKLATHQKLATRFCYHVR